MAAGRAVQVHIWGWDELQRRIRQHPEAMRASDPEYGASTNELLELGCETVEVARETTAELAAARTDQRPMANDVQQILALVRGADAGSGAARDKVFDQQVDALRDLLNRGRPKSIVSSRPSADSSREQSFLKREQDLERDQRDHR